MIRPVLIFLSIGSLIFLAACQSEQPQKPHPKHPFGWQPEPVAPEGAPGGDIGPQDTGNPTTPDNGGAIAPPPPPPPSTSNPGTSAPAATPGAQTKKDYPYAQPVAGKPGFVTSPFMPNSGYVDVRGFPPGTEVKDPYSGKIFLVP
jgi:hypothetical protein